MLTGYKTYITAGLMVALGAASIFGINIPGFTADPGTLIMSALGLVFARNATANATGK